MLDPRTHRWRAEACLRPLERIPSGTARAGTTLLELMVVITILVVAVSILSRIVLATSRLRETNRENAIASEAARMVLERMRGADYRKVFALYNSDPGDDPGGTGTAPGDRFEIPGLKPLESAEGMVEGHVVFPTIAESLVPLEVKGTEDGEEIQPPGGGEAGGATGGGVLGGGTQGTPTGGLLIPLAIAPPTPSVFVPLREDCVYPLLGMPRDLNGDSIVDDDDHAADYLILPVQVRIEWEGSNGPRVMDLFTMLTRFKKGG